MAAKKPKAKKPAQEPKAKPEGKQGTGRPPPPEHTRFKPGQSGNLGGMPKEIVEVRRAARDHTKEAIERLAFWMRSDNPKASVSATVALLNRGWGMPTQTVNTTVRNLRQMTDAELVEYLTSSDEGVSGEGTSPASVH